MRLIHYDRWGARLGDAHPATSARLTIEATGAETLEFDTFDTTPPSKGDRILAYAPIGGEAGWREYRVMSTQTLHEDRLPRTSMVCKSSMNELALYWIDALAFESRPMGEILERLLQDTPWVAGTVDDTGTYTLAFDSMTVKQAVDALIKARAADQPRLTAIPSFTADAWGITARKVDLRASRGRGSAPQARLTFGVDASSVKRTFADTEVVTRLHATGAEVDGEKITLTVEDADATAKYGVPGPDGRPLPAVGSWEDSGEKSPELLRAKAEARLKELSRPRVSYEVVASTLIRTGDLGPGDRVAVLDTGFAPPMRLDSYVSKLEFDLLDGSAPKATLSDTPPLPPTDSQEGIQ